MLAYVQLLPLAQVQRDALADRVPREGNPAGAERASDEEVEAGDLPLHGALELPQLDVDARLLPEEHVVLVHDADVAEVDLELGHQLPADVVADAGELLVVDLAGDGFRYVHRAIIAARPGAVHLGHAPALTALANSA